jgi:protein gp37
MAYRQSKMGTVGVCKGYGEVVTNQHWNGKTRFQKSQLNKPLERKKTTMYFVCSMGDLFHESVPELWKCKVIDVIKKCPQHIFQILTKRPKEMYDFFIQFPRPTNVWLGVTAENQEMADNRIPILLKIPAAKRFVSIEPMLSPVDLDKNISKHCSIKPSAFLDWCIVGAESGNNRRECKPEWIDSIVNQCKAAGVPCFVKQAHDDKQGKVIHQGDPEWNPDWPQEYPKD